MKPNKNTYSFLFRRSYYLWIFANLIFLVFVGWFCALNFSLIFSDFTKLESNLIVKTLDSLSVTIISEENKADLQEKKKYANFFSDVELNLTLGEKTRYSFSDIFYEPSTKEESVIFYVENGIDKYYDIVSVNSIISDISMNNNDSIDFYLMDSNKYGIFFEKEKTKFIDYENSAFFEWLSNSIVRINNSFHFFKTKRIGKFTVFFFYKLSRIIVPLAVFSFLPLILGFVIIFISQIFTEKELKEKEDVINGITENLKEEVPFSKWNLPENDFGFQSLFFEIKNFYLKREKDTLEIEGLLEKNSYQNEIIRDQLTQISSINQFFQKVALTENFTFHQAVENISKVFFDSDASIRNCEVFLNNELLFKKHLEAIEDINSIFFEIKNREISIKIKIEFEKTLQERDILLKKELIKNSFYTLTVVFFLKKEIRKQEDTGLLSLEYFFERAEIELLKNIRYSREFVFGILSFDSPEELKILKYEKVLKNVITLVSEQIMLFLRNSDLYSKYSDECFYFILLETDISAARKKIEALKELIETKLTEKYPGKKLVIKIGLSVSEYGKKRLQQIIAEAENNQLY